jgi:DNA-binding CsgD family transcriptional regulator
MLNNKSKENLIIIGTDSSEISTEILNIVKRYSTERIIQVKDDSDLYIALQKYKPRLIILESSFWFSATPYRIAELLEKDQGLNFSVFKKERMLDIAASRFITSGKVNSFIDMRSEDMHGLQKEYMYGFEETVNGKMYMPKSIEAAAEKYRIEMHDGYANKIKLTNHQIGIGLLTAEGVSVIDIGKILNISPKTVGHIQGVIRSKYGLKSRNDITYLMIRLGYMPSEKIEANIQKNITYSTECEEKKKELKSQRRLDK